MKRFAKLGLLLATIAACGVESPGEDVTFDAGPTGPDAGEVDETVTLEITPPPATSNFTQEPVNGKGPAGGRVYYQVPGLGLLNHSIDSDGTFCVVLPLVTGSPNTFQFYAISATGGRSETKSISITQAGPAPDPGGGGSAPGFENIARGAILTDADVEFGDVDSMEGEVNVLTDGPATSALTIWEDWGAANNSGGSSYIKFKLKKQAPVFAATIATAADCPTERFEWFTSNEDADPGLPNEVLGSYDWQTKWSIQGSVDEEATSFNLSPRDGQPTARWFALRIISDDCDGGGWTDRSKHKLTEIQVLTLKAPEGGEPDDGNPSCGD